VAQITKNIQPLLSERLLLFATTHNTGHAVRACPIGQMLTQIALLEIEGLK